MGYVDNFWEWWLETAKKLSEMNTVKAYHGMVDEDSHPTKKQKKAQKDAETERTAPMLYYDEFGNPKLRYVSPIIMDEGSENPFMRAISVMVLHEIFAKHGDEPRSLNALQTIKEKEDAGIGRISLY